MSPEDWQSRAAAREETHRESDPHRMSATIPTDAHGPSTAEVKDNESYRTNLGGMDGDIGQLEARSRTVLLTCHLASRAMDAAAVVGWVGGWLVGVPADERTD